MKSILQNDLTVCFLCEEHGTWDDPLDNHHVFGAALRSKSERLGLKVMLHHSKCHEDGKESVHKCRATANAIKAVAQRTLIDEHGWTQQQFMKEFYKNYL